jgi:hypothetical protein
MALARMEHGVDAVAAVVAVAIGVTVAVVVIFAMALFVFFAVVVSRLVAVVLITCASTSRLQSCCCHQLDLLQGSQLTRHEKYVITGSSLTGFSRGYKTLVYDS